jgi:ABC-2 type transport system ATP-binding protein
MSLVEFKNVYKAYGKKEILKDVSFKIESGKIVGLLGKNGVGKSTIIKLLNDLITPTSGEVLFDGLKPGVESKRRISYLPEKTYLDRSMKVKEVLKYYSEFFSDFDIERAKELLKDLNLDLEDYLVKMSKGMLEKLQLVLTMSRNADLYILDEPLGGVDPATRDYILDTILSNFKEGSSVIVSTHIISDIEKILDEVIFIDNGEIVLYENADELRQERNASIDEIFRGMFKC